MLQNSLGTTVPTYSFFLATCLFTIMWRSILWKFSLVFWLFLLDFCFAKFVYLPYVIKEFFCFFCFSRSNQHKTFPLSFFMKTLKSKGTFCICLYCSDELKRQILEFFGKRLKYIGEEISKEKKWTNECTEKGIGR